jgi:gas vesicle protein
MRQFEAYGEYEQSERSGGKAGTAITFLLVGLGVGALTALLFAPRSGRQTRETLRRKYDETVDSLSEQTENIRERSSEWMQTARERMGR